MPIKWKKKKKLNPDVLLDRIDNVKYVQSDGRVSFNGFEYQEVVPSLFSMLDFGRKLPWEIRTNFVSQAISKVAAREKLNSINVIHEINNEYRKYHGKKEEEYFLLTSISFAEPLPAKLININGCNIRIFDSGYPKKYVSRQTIYTKWQESFEHTPNGYSKIIIKSKAKSPQEAVSISLESIDLLRAIWNLFANSRMEIFGNSWEPINKIRLGGMHSLHKKNGKLAVEYFWYEPTFKAATPFKLKIDSYNKFKKNCTWDFKQLSQCKYSETLKDALLRYVRALDASDQNTAAFKLWSAIEAIAAPTENNYDSIIRRCAFLFEEEVYHKQILEHLREYRNSTVHAGEESTNAKHHCFQLQFYFFHLVHFHLRKVKDFDKINEANMFLDMPTDVRVLEKRKHLIEKAINFINNS